MYTFNIYCFGHKMSDNKELNNLLHGYDIEFSDKIGNRRWEINFPYHGGQVAGDCHSCVFGTQITNDDNNPNYIDKIRSSAESDYLPDYNKFIDIIMKKLEEYAELENEIKHIVDKLKKHLSENKPGFYTVEASS